MLKQLNIRDVFEMGKVGVGEIMTFLPQKQPFSTKVMYLALTNAKLSCIWQKR